jgi:hypothetical protein
LEQKDFRDCGFVTSSADFFLALADVVSYFFHFQDYRVGLKFIAGFLKDKTKGHSLCLIGQRTNKEVRNLF